MPRVLMYHMVREHIPKARFNKMRVLPDDFAWQMEWLIEDGWRFLSTSDLVERWGNWPDKSVVVTFDDGFQDNYINAYPILEMHGIFFTIFVVCNRHGNDWSVNKKAHHTSGELANEPKLTDLEIREMLSSGLLEIGGHTLNHVNLLNESAETKSDEIAGCFEFLQSRFETNVATFCYPFGLYDQDSVNIVKETPYHGAFTVEEKLIEPDSDPFEIGRLKVSGKMSRRQFRRMMYTGTRKLF